MLTMKITKTVSAPSNVLLCGKLEAFSLIVLYFIYVSFTYLYMEGMRKEELNGRENKIRRVLESEKRITSEDC